MRFVLRPNLFRRISWVTRISAQLHLVRSIAMSSIGVFSWSAVVLGVLAATVVGVLGHGLRGGFWVFAFAVAAFVFSVGLVWGANAANNLCVSTSKLCSSTSDTTVWSLFLPVLFAPLYWAMMLVARGWRKPSAQGDV